MRYLVVLPVIFLSSLQATSPAKDRVIVSLFSNSAVSQSAARIFTSHCRDALFTDGTFTVVDGDGVYTRLKELQRNQSGVYGGTAGAASDAVEAELVMIGDVALSSQGLHLSIRLVDIETGTVMSSVSTITRMREGRSASERLVKRMIRLYEANQLPPQRRATARRNIASVRKPSDVNKLTPYHMIHLDVSLGFGGLFRDHAPGGASLPQYHSFLAGVARTSFEWFPEVDLRHWGFYSGYSEITSTESRDDDVWAVHHIDVFNFGATYRNHLHLNSAAFTYHVTVGAGQHQVRYSPAYSERGFTSDNLDTASSTYSYNAFALVSIRTYFTNHFYAGFGWEVATFDSTFGSNREVFDAWAYSGLYFVGMSF